MKGVAGPLGIPGVGCHLSGCRSRQTSYVRDGPSLEAVEEPNSEELLEGPSRPQDRVPLSVARFRAERQYLADRVFLTVPGGGAPPNELVDRKTWEGIMVCRPTCCFGRLTIWATWSTI